MKYLHFTLIFILVLKSFVIFGQDVTVDLKDDGTISGYLLILTGEQIAIDPEGSVSFLNIDINTITSIFFKDSEETLYFPITDDQINLFLSKIKFKGNKNKSYYNNYWDVYILGGKSSSHEVFSELIYVEGMYLNMPIIYKNSGFGGIGFNYLCEIPNKSMAYAIDGEIAFIKASFITIFDGEEFELLQGMSMSSDLEFSLYPFHNEESKIPQLFVFGGLGLRFIGMENVSEIHGALPFGAGLRWKIHNKVAIQLKERAVYSSLEDVKAFTLFETRLELHININRG